MSQTVQSGVVPFAQRKQLNRIWASDPTAGVVPIDDVKYQKGWIAEIPAFQHLNWLQQQMDINMLALAERGFFEYGADVKYRKGSLVWRDTDNTVYIALVDNPTTPPPSLQWDKSCVQLSRTEFEFLFAQWQAHISDRDNPHQVTANQIGAVPITGGAYTGKVSHTEVEIGGVAGKTVLLEDGDGSNWVYDGVKAFNVSPTGELRTFFQGQWWGFLYKENYVENRTLYEGTFAIPAAAIDIPMAYALYPIVAPSGANVSYTRAGTLNYTNKIGAAAVAQPDEPAFGRRGLVIRKRDVEVTNMPIPANREFTIAISYNRMSGANVSSQTLLESEGNFKLTLVSGRINLSQTGQTDKSFLQPSGGWVTVVLRFNGTNVQMFVNGELAFDSLTFSPVIQNAKMYVGGVADTSTNVEITALKMWYSVLTSEQILGL